MFKVWGFKMELLLKTCQIIIGLGLLNVWLLRTNQATAWRGGDSKSMREEFAVYGLSAAFMKIIGFLKVTLGLCLILGLWMPELTRPAAYAVAALMIGALAMHVKVKDPLQRSLPAFTLFVLALAVAIF